MGKPRPTNPKLYARIKAQTKRKFKVWPSAYGSAKLTRDYKAAGGGYTSSGKASRKKRK